MIIRQKDYLSYELPKNRCVEEKEDNIILYNAAGEGALVVSFYNILEKVETLDEYISIMAKKFIDQNKIKLDAPFIVYGTEDTKIVLNGVGTTVDNWFIKLWLVARYPKIVLATYQCENKTSELKKCDAVINSMQFLF